MRLSLSVLAVMAAAASVPAVASAESLALKPTIAADPGDDGTTVPPARKPVTAADTDPYAPLGIRAAGMILLPSLTLDAGYTTNAGATAGGTPSPFGSVSPELLLKSDWPSNAFSLDLKGTYQKFTNDAADDKPTGSANASVTLDLPHDWTANLDGGVAYDRQTLADTANPPDGPSGVTSFTSSAALDGNIGALAVTVTGSADRTLYADTTTAGVSVDQSDRNNNLFGGKLRVGYDGGGILTPFVEGEVDRRVYDQTVDDNGKRRSGTGYAVRGGVEFNSDPVLSGEISVGTWQQTFDDPTLASIGVVTVDGNLVWSPSRLTTVTVDTTTTVNPGTDPSSSGSVVHDGSVEVAYAWRPNVDLSAKAELSREEYQGTGEIDDTYDLSLNSVWKLNRNLQLGASYVHEWLASSDPTNNYQSDTVKVELRAQH
jgi:hypothetical protein